ncbi:hypothetical protein DKT68_00130, partial [Micromonospora acroterricola]
MLNPSGRGTLPEATAAGAGFPTSYPHGGGPPLASAPEVRSYACIDTTPQSPRSAGALPRYPRRRAGPAVGGSGGGGRATTTGRHATTNGGRATTGGGHAGAGGGDTTGGRR